MSHIPEWCHEEADRLVHFDRDGRVAVALRDAFDRGVKYIKMTSHDWRVYANAAEEAISALATERERERLCFYHRVPYEEVGDDLFFCRSCDDATRGTIAARATYEKTRARLDRLQRASSAFIQDDCYLPNQVSTQDEHSEPCHELRAALADTTPEPASKPSHAERDPGCPYCAFERKHTPVADGDKETK
jgi:hypothetical protein